jgi:hypothetical protein
LRAAGLLDPIEIAINDMDFGGEEQTTEDENVAELEISPYND